MTSKAGGGGGASDDEARLARARELAAIVGLDIDPAELPEVAARLDCLLIEMQTLDGLDLDGIDPVALFAEGAR
jgi:hypothetical protein